MTKTFHCWDIWIDINKHIKLHMELRGLNIYTQPKLKTLYNSIRKFLNEHMLQKNIIKKKKAVLANKKDEQK